MPSFGTRIKYVRVKKANLDYEYEKDCTSGKGIILNQVEAYTKKGEKNYNGLQSPFFGSDFSDETQYQERWACKCKRYVGKAYQGYVCEYCHEEVDFIGTDLSKFGYIAINHFKTLSPLAILKLNDVMGKISGEFVLDKILDVRYNTSVPDKFMNTESKDYKKHPFLYKGMRWFQEHFEEVMMHYLDVKPTKRDIIMELLDEPQKVFVSHIAVISSAVRPEAKGEKDKKLYKLKINYICQTMIRLANQINDLGDPSEMTVYNFTEIDKSLYAFQKQVNAYANEILTLLCGKKGVFQGKLLSGRFNFTARCVITPSTEEVLEIDEIELPYIAFLELYRYELINIYANERKINLIEANAAWQRATIRFDEKFWKIGTAMIQKHPDMMECLINRNPSINYGSFVCVHVVRIKHNIEDKTLTIPNGILKSMNADFDGDQLNIFRIHTKYFCKKFRNAMAPSKTLAINKIDGKVNKDIMPSKDEIAVIHMMMLD